MAPTNWQMKGMTWRAGCHLQKKTRKHQWEEQCNYPDCCMVWQPSTPPTGWKPQLANLFTGGLSISTFSCPTSSPFWKRRTSLHLLVTSLSPRLQSLMAPRCRLHSPWLCPSRLSPLLTVTVNSMSPLYNLATCSSPLDLYPALQFRPRNGEDTLLTTHPLLHEPPANSPVFQWRWIQPVMLCFRTGLNWF